MEFESMLQCWQDPVTGACPGGDVCRPFSPNEIHLIATSTPALEVTRSLKEMFQTKDLN
jgi:hypothetical protein